MNFQYIRYYMVLIVCLLMLICNVLAFSYVLGLYEFLTYECLIMTICLSSNMTIWLYVFVKALGFNVR